MTVDEAVQRAVAEHEAWIRQAAPSIDKVDPRVMVQDDQFEGLRRPFKHRGHWCIRAGGIARLVNPRIEAGPMVVFGISYDRWGA